MQSHLDQMIHSKPVPSSICTCIHISKRIGNSEVYHKETEAGVKCNTPLTPKPTLGLNRAALAACFAISAACCSAVLSRVPVGGGLKEGAGEKAEAASRFCEGAADVAPAARGRGCWADTGLARRAVSPGLLGAAGDVAAGAAVADAGLAGLDAPSVSVGKRGD